MIYLDNQATTRIDPVVLEAMLPFFGDLFANPGSVTHQAGRDIAEWVDRATESIARGLGADPSEIVFTSGATESNNLAILGACLHPRQKRRRILSLKTEHKAVLDPLAKLAKNGFDLEWIPVQGPSDPSPSLVDLDHLATRIDDTVAMVTVMLANNEVGTIQPIAEMAKLCRKHDILLHTDATQGVGKFPIDVDQLDVDLMSFSAHKFYGPKGIGALYVRDRKRRVRLEAQILGGSQQRNRRSGTLNVPGIIGMAKALEEWKRLSEAEPSRIKAMRDRFWTLIKSAIPDMKLNGPSWDVDSLRLPNNLNCQFPGVEGQSLMMHVPEIACSSGSACTSANPEPSHVLLGIGYTEDEARSSLRFGFGRFNHVEEIERGAEWIIAAYHKLLSNL